VKFGQQSKLQSFAIKREGSAESFKTTANGEMKVANLRMVVGGMRYESEAAVFRTLEDGVMELKAEKIRMIKVPATL
jgi:hypothetical protein